MLKLIRFIVALAMAVVMAGLILCTLAALAAFVILGALDEAIGNG